MPIAPARPAISASGSEQGYPELGVERPGWSVAAGLLKQRLRHDPAEDSNRPKADVHHCRKLTFASHSLAVKNGKRAQKFMTLPNEPELLDPRPNKYGQYTGKAEKEGPAKHAKSFSLRLLDHGEMVVHLI